MNKSQKKKSVFPNDFGIQIITTTDYNETDKKYKLFPKLFNVNTITGGTVIYAKWVERFFVNSQESHYVAVSFFHSLTKTNCSKQIRSNKQWVSGPTERKGNKLGLLTVQEWELLNKTIIERYQNETSKCPKSKSKRELCSLGVHLDLVSWTLR